MAIVKLTNVTYYDFKNLEIIYPDKFDTNFNDCVTKIDEIVDAVNDDVAAMVTHKASNDHDGKYYTETELNAGQLNNLYYTETELNAGQLNNLYYTETELNAGQLDTRYFTETETNAIKADLEGVGRTTETIKSNADNLVTHKSSTDHDGRYYTQAQSDNAFNSLGGVGRTTETIKANYDALVTHKGSTDHDGRYYTETELQTSGGASIHWNNLTNVPAMADDSWKAPVANVAALPLADNTDGDLRIVLDIDTVYTWNSSAWEVIGASGNGISDHGTLVGLGDDDHTQYLRTDGTRALTGDISFGKNEAQNMVIHNSATSPADPVDGQVWYDTSSNKLKVYRGSVAGWSSCIDGSAVIKDKEFTATASQTVFSIADTGTYEIGKNLMSVYKKNVAGRYDLLDESDYTETSTTVITLGTGASVGEVFYLKWFENNPNTVSDLSAYVTTESLTSATSSAQVTSLAASTVKGELSAVLGGNTSNGYDANTKLLMYMNGTDASTSFIDQTGKTVVASGNAQIDTAQYKYDGASGLFDGTGDYLTVTDANNDLDLGTGDFTIEMWVRFNSVAVSQYLIDFKQSSSTDLSPYVYFDSSVVKIKYYPGTLGVITGTTTIVAGIWYHIAVTRSSGITKLFINGVQEGSNYTDANDYIAVSAIKIGAKYDNNASINGWIDELRISNSARYTTTFEPNTLNFQHTNMQRIKSVGKNLFDKSKVRYGAYNITTGIFASDSSTYATEKTRIPPNQNIILSGYVNTVRYLFWDVNNNLISTSAFSSGYQTAPSNAYWCAYQGAYVNFPLDTIQLELGTTATTYEAYTETTATIPVTLRSVSSTIKDTFDANTGKHTKNVSEYTLQSADITALTTTLTNVDYVKISKRTDYKGYLTGNVSGLDAKMGHYTTTTVLFASIDDVAYINNLAVNCDNDEWLLIVPKGAYADLATAKTALTGSIIVYQLTTPVVTNYWSNVLTAEPSGTVIAEPFINDVGLYSTNIAIADTSYPISSLSYVNRIHTVTGKLTPIAISACTVAAGGLTFTVTDAIAGDFYEYGYNYIALSTNGSLAYSYGTSLKAQVNGNSEQIKDLDVKVERLADIVEVSTSASSILTSIKTVDGTGSGLDADTLDGNEATAFATSAQGILATNALPKGGGTMTGSAIGYASTAYTTAQFRNVVLSTSDPSGGSNGDIWIKYDA